MNKNDTLTCQIQGHEYEPLYDICCDQQCKISGLMCYLCHETIHAKHKSIPYKLFVNNVKRIGRCDEQTILLSAKIDKILQQIKNEFRKIKKIEILDQNIIEIINQYCIKYKQACIQLTDLPQQFAKLQQKSSNINAFIRKNFHKIYLNDTNNTDLNANLYNKILQDKYEQLQKMHQQLQIELKNQLIDDQKILKMFHYEQIYSKKIRFIFTEELKGSCMTIHAPNKASMTTSGSQRLLILSPALSNNMHNKKWSIRVQKLASWIGIGICHLNLIKNANFYFNYSNTGHGSYLISSNGYSWSSLKPQYNSKLQPFPYKTGDVVHLQYCPKQKLIKFKKDSDGKTYQLEFDFIEGDPIHPAINLTGIGDCVEILD